jgi:mRNA interferase MazF
MVAVAPHIPRRGDVIRLDFDPQMGHEQAGRRLAVVLSNDDYNRKTGLCIACPITPQSKGYAFEIAIPRGLPYEGVVLSDQVKCLDWRARNAEFVDTMPPTVLATVKTRLKLLLDG